MSGVACRKPAAAVAVEDLLAAEEPGQLGVGFKTVAEQHCVDLDAAFGAGDHAPIAVDLGNNGAFDLPAAFDADDDRRIGERDAPQQSCAR